MTTEHALSMPALDGVREAVDPVVHRALQEAATELGTVDPRARLVVDEIARLVQAGGKRVRPAFCVWGFRAGGGDAGAVGGVRGPIVRVAAALELLHTMALIHDDLMDEASERRGVASTSSHLAEEAVLRGLPVDADRFGRSGAILAGDLAAVLADRLMVSSGFRAEVLVRALVRYHEMRVDMAAGQMLDVAGLARQPGSALVAARLKGGSYSVEGPLLIGATLADAEPAVTDALRAFGVPLGEAFQLRDDLRDRDGAHGATPETVNDLVARARAALHDAPIAAEAATALVELAGTMAVPP
jgi:geranylgeranyl diphosphate synthase, type I